MHACFLISHVHTRLSMVSYAFRTPNRARCKIHAVNPNKVRSKHMYASNGNPESVCRAGPYLLPTSLGRLSMPREVPNRWGHRHVAPDLGVVHSLQTECNARLLAMYINQGFCHETAARHLRDRRSPFSQVLAELAEIEGEGFGVGESEAQLFFSVGAGRW